MDASRSLSYLFILDKESREDEVRRAIVEEAIRLIGTKYTWSGSSPEQGFDCSGFVTYVSETFGVKFRKSHLFKTRSKGILESINEFSQTSIGEISIGDLLFFGKSIDEITHIAIAVSKYFMIEAGGEGKNPTDLGAVRIRPIRSDLVAIRSIFPMIQKSISEMKEWKLSQM